MTKAGQWTLLTLLLLNTLLDALIIDQLIETVWQLPFIWRMGNVLTTALLVSAEVWCWHTGVSPKAHAPDQEDLPALFQPARTCGLGMVYQPEDDVALCGLFIELRSRTPQEITRVEWWVHALLTVPNPQAPNSEDFTPTVELDPDPEHNTPTTSRESISRGGNV